MSSAVVFVLVCCVNGKKTLHKARLTALHAIWLHELSVSLRQYRTNDEKFDDASVAQSLCGIALILYVLNQIKLVYYVKDK